MSVYSVIKISLLVALSVAASSSVFAGDLLTKAPPPVVPTYDWSGIYVGGHLGGGWQSTTFQDPSATTAVLICCSFVGGLGAGDTAPSATASAFLGGVQTGWNYQIDRLVVGADFDWSDTSLKGNSSAVIPGAVAGAANAAAEKFSAHTDWTATATATAGITNDRWLLYSKAGLAFARETYSLAVQGPGGATFASTANDTRSGWIVGAGLAWAYSSNWSAKIEYDYLNFPTKPVDFSGIVAGQPTTFNTNNNQNISELKLGINYKFAPSLVAGDAAGASGHRGAPQIEAVNWTGFYVGGHVGSGWQNTAFQDPSASSAISICCEPLGLLQSGSAASSSSGSAFLGGLQAGWNYQIKKLVIGADFDWSGTSLNGTSAGVIPAAPGGFPASETFGVRTDWTATATATAGIADDRWLLYSKAGLALAHDRYSLAVNGANVCFAGGCTGVPFSFASNASDTRLGWTLGTGLAWAYSNNWSVKIEYDYLDFPTKAVDFNGIIQNALGGPPVNNGPLTGASTFNTNNSQHISEFKVGLNYKFGPNLLLDGDSGDAAATHGHRASSSAEFVNWTGFYVGGHLGGGWQNTAFQDPSATTNLILCCELLASLAPGSAAPNASGSAFLGGAQLGWNYQIQRLVVGADFDWSGTNMNGKSVDIIPGGLPGLPNATETFGVRTDWTATATATVGLTHDRWLVYGKGGFASAHDSYTLGLNGSNTGCCIAVGGGLYSFASSASGTRIGWTVGTGLAWAYSNNWSAKIEYDYLEFPTKSVDFSGTFQNPGQGLNSVATFNTNNNQHISEVKVGVNYKLPPGLLF